MPPNAVVKALDILENDLLRLPTRLERDTVDTFTLQGAKKGFGHRIIIAVASAAHAYRDTSFR